MLRTSIPEHETPGLLRSINDGVYHATKVICPVYQYFDAKGKNVYSARKPEYGTDFTEYDFSYRDQVVYITEYNEYHHADNKFYAWFE